MARACAVGAAAQLQPRAPCAGLAASRVCCLRCCAPMAAACAMGCVGRRRPPRRSQAGARACAPRAWVPRARLVMRRSVLRSSGAMAPRGRSCRRAVRTSHATCRLGAPLCASFGASALCVATHAAHSHDSVSFFSLRVRVRIHKGIWDFLMLTVKLLFPLLLNVY